tara:strand:+ start:144 stop:383 length:240 start_codon:yes stop_codon:yes gene_type:complete
MNLKEINDFSLPELHTLTASQIAIFYKPIMSKEEVSKLLSKSIKTIETWVRDDEIPYRKKKNSTYFLREEIMEWMDNCA